MAFQWLKSIMPKGLYGRAALILVIPIITIQLVVSVVFIQRHFDGVTEQLTREVARELSFLLDRVENAPSKAQAQNVIVRLGAPLGFSIRPLDARHQLTGDKKSFDDLTGKAVIRAIRTRLPAITHVDLTSLKRRVVLHVATSKGPYEVQFDRLRVSTSNPHQLLVLMIAVSLFMTLISFIFLRNQVRPIRRLARVAEAFGMGRHLPYVLAGAREVRQAGQAFLDMRARIERQIEQRTLMLSGVSHDLRTPLTRLKLGLSLSGGDEAENMVRDVDDMEMMLDEFLTFARGDSLEETQLCNPEALAHQVAEDTKRSGGEITLTPSEQAAFADVEMRPVAIRRALDNLVTNALRYGSRCRLGLERTQGAIVFVVEDDGPGIPPDARETAIKPFERLDQARNQNRGTGVGLGLAIATDIASSHGGRLVLSDSEALGGLRAELHLPV